MANNTQNGERKDIGAAWVRTSKSGQKYWSIKVTLDGKTYSLVGFKNSYKDRDIQPDLKIYISDSQQKQDADLFDVSNETQTAAPTKKQVRPPKASKGNSNPVENDRGDDVDADFFTSNTNIDPLDKEDIF